MKVAIVHDWLVGGGAERVVEQLHKIYPEAPIYTSYCSDEWRKRLDGKVVTGWLQNWPFSTLRKFLPVFRIWWFTRLDLSVYDLVISSSGAEAKGIKTQSGTTHISYIHAPTHYYWDRYDQYMDQPGFGVFDPLARLGLRLLIGPLRRWDYKAAQRPDYLIANSNYTKQMIKKHYGRDSVVIHPPVDIERFAGAKSKKRHGFVITGRQTPYKRVNLAVEACTKLNLPLTVIGNGPDHGKLVKAAGPSVEFVTGASDKEVADRVGSAEAFIFPVLDDFGISAVEALAAGTPVIAYGEGGALDYIEPGKNGLLFKPQTAKSLAGIIAKFHLNDFNSAEIVKKAEIFSAEKFKILIAEFIKKRV